ncbi:MAG: phosphopantetheine-binding protein [Polyangiales bacterium]
MEATLREIIARIAEVPADFDGNAHLRDELDVDSFRAAEIAFEIERVFKIKMPDEQYVAATTANDILKLLTSLAA